MALKFFVFAGLFVAPALFAATGTTTSLAASANPINFGAPLTLTATVTPAGVTGKVTFYDGVTVLGTAALSATGKATLSTTALPSGARKLRAYYLGDANNSSGSSAVLAQTVRAIPGTGFNIVSATHESGMTAVFVVPADLNGDGKTDIAVANSDSNDVSILLGRGNGTFQTAVNYPVGTAPAALAVADLNGDGAMDLIVANSGSGDLSILLGKGDGTFSAAVSLPVAGSPVSVVVADFNADGIADLAVANGKSSVGVLLGKGDGTFQLPVNVLVGAGPAAIAVADMNGDGKADLVTANLGGQNISVLLGRGDGNFLSASAYDATDAAGALAIGDFNGDGKADVAILGGSSGLRILLGNGDGSLGAATAWPVDGAAIALADFNGDGKTDIATADLTISESLGSGDGKFLPVTTYETPSMTLFHLAVADFNGDGRADIVTANGQDNNLSVLLGQPFAITGVSNAAGGGLTVQSGSWVAIYGSGLALTTRAWDASDFVGKNLPTVLDGVKVNINGKPAAVFFISPDQIDVQAPADTATGPVQVQVLNSYGTANGTVMLQPYAPAFFAYLGKYAVAVHLDGTFVAPPGALGPEVTTRPAKPGETIVLYGTGFGPTSPALPAGQIITGFAGLANPTDLKIRVGGLDATVQFSGLVAAGEFQFNVVVPLNAPNGSLPILATIGGQNTQTPLFVPVQN